MCMCNSSLWTFEICVTMPSLMQKEVIPLVSYKSHIRICPLVLRNFVESILIGDNVLMITNLNDLYTLVSWPNRLKIGPLSWLCYSWLIAIENRVRSRLMHCLQEQDEIRSLDKVNRWFPGQVKNKEPGWSMRQVGSRCTKFSSHLRCFKNLCIFIN